MTTQRRVTREELKQTPLYEGFIRNMVSRYGEGVKSCIEEKTDEIYGGNSEILISDAFFSILESDVSTEMRRNRYNQE